jgi:hypothetical protein
MLVFNACTLIILFSSGFANYTVYSRKLCISSDDRVVLIGRIWYRMGWVADCWLRCARRSGTNYICVGYYSNIFFINIPVTGRGDV